METFIRVNGEIVFFTTAIGSQGIAVNESGSEQCEGCGLDIIETGIAKPGLVVCGKCGAKYPIRLGNRE